MYLFIFTILCVHYFSKQILNILYRHIDTSSFGFSGNRKMLSIPSASVYIEYIKYDSIQNVSSKLHALKIPFKNCMYHNNHNISHHPDGIAVGSFN